ncbi:protein rep [Candidatus Pacearchaeota archaeon]|nr:protein rep [Candidatus Pacearchaeota archaeon]
MYDTLSVLAIDEKLDRFLDCRKKAWFVQNQKTFEVRVASKKCTLRWCPLCAGSRRHFIGTQTLTWLKSAKFPKFLTLTLRHTSAPLSSQIDFLYESFRQLRKRNYFKKNVKGGVWFFQVKKSKVDGLWHPHLHCVICGNWVAHRKLKDMWIRITKGSDIVHIKPCIDLKKSADYIARYAAKPAILKELSIDEQIELYQSMAGRRIVGAWGNARPMSFRPCKPDDSADWQHAGWWSTVNNMRRHDADAADIWRAFTTGVPLEGRVSMYKLEQLMAGNDIEPRVVPAVTGYLDFMVPGS